jgi:hypothetical protein
VIGLIVCVDLKLAYKSRLVTFNAAVLPCYSKTWWFSLAGAHLLSNLHAHLTTYLGVP